MAEREVDASANLRRRSSPRERERERARRGKHERTKGRHCIYRLGKSRGSYVKRGGTGNTPRKRRDYIVIREEC